MDQDWNRRDFLSLMSLGGLAFASGLPLPGCAPSPRASEPEDFFFLQLSDTHWGFQGAPNPEANVTLEHAVATINSVDLVPDFIVFTGDLTHTTDDPAQRRERMKRFREIVSALKVKDVRFLPGEHDAAPDRGEAYREIFGGPTYAFDHKGVHFVALDNVSLPGGALGDAQLQWLEADLARMPADVRVVVLTHRPLFPLSPEWEWATKDGDAAIQILQRRPAVTVFYGHIHQEHHRVTGNVSHHAARSLVFPLPVPGSVPKKAPLPWDSSSPDHGLGWRSVALIAPTEREQPGGAPPRITEIAYR
jgi:hypothetical protein